MKVRQEMNATVHLGSMEAAVTDLRGTCFTAQRGRRRSQSRVFIPGGGFADVSFLLC